VWRLPIWEALAGLGPCGASGGQTRSPHGTESRTAFRGPAPLEPFESSRAEPDGQLRTVKLETAGRPYGQGPPTAASVSPVATHTEQQEPRSNPRGR
jgi:hypothetical protein